jgi:hypothetical protein
MILTAHQVSYLPWLGLFHKIALSDVYCFLDNVQFEKNSFANRNKIKTERGGLWLTVPVHSEGHFNFSLKDLKIDNSQNWANKHWKAIYFNYKKCPYFKDYDDFLKSVYEKEWVYLSDLCYTMLVYFLHELGIDVKVVKGSDLGLEEKKQELIFELCANFNSDFFVFGKLGIDYAKEEDFSKKGIKMYFQDYQHPVYPQTFGEFLPYMSIIDLLFNCGPKSLEVLMQGNITKEELKKIYAKT